MSGVDPASQDFVNEETRALLRLQAWGDKGRRYGIYRGKINGRHCFEVYRTFGKRVVRVCGKDLAEAINKALDQAEAEGI